MANALLTHTYLYLTGYAIPAVNCVSSSGINACLEAARKNDAPIIIQFSAGGSQVRNRQRPAAALGITPITARTLAHAFALISCSSMEERPLTTKTTQLQLRELFPERSMSEQWLSNTEFQSFFTPIIALRSFFHGSTVCCRLRNAITRTMESHCFRRT